MGSGAAATRRSAALIDAIQRLRPGQLAAGIFGCAVLAIVAGAIGVISGQFGYYALIAAVAVLLIGIAATDIGLIPVMAFPAGLLMVRAAGALSVSDLVLGAAVLPAVLLINMREADSLRPFIWLGVIYQAGLVPSLILDPYRSNYIEWVHQAFLVLGSLVVGWVVGRQGRAALALSMFLWGCVIVSVVTVIYGLINAAHGQLLQPVYFPYFHKNFIGNSLAYAFLMLFVRPDWTGWSARMALWLLPLFALGIAASGARQAMVSVVVALLILALRSAQAGGGKARVLLLALLPALWYVLNTVRDQLNSDNQFNSTSQRLIWFRDSIEIWLTSPLFGVGQRWWYRPEYLHYAFQPPNAFMEMLTTAGVVGLVVFIVLCVGAVWMIFRVDPRFGNIALVVMIARFTQGQLDLYWVAGQASFLWLVTGAALGAQALERRQRRSPGLDSGTPVSGTVVRPA